MKQIKIILLILILVTAGFAQMLSLEECFRMAEKNHPLMKQKSPINDITKNELKNINTKWLPVLDFNLSATYQSDITSIDVKIPVAMAGAFEMPSPDKDNYKTEIEINQLIYDGGLVSIQKELAKQDNKILLQQLETSFHEIKKSITQVYYNLLILDAQKIILECWIADLVNSKETVKNLIINGVADSTGLYEIEIQIHQLKQKEEENKIYRDSNFKILSELVGEKLSNLIVLYNPEDSKNQEIFNAQSLLFDYQLARFEIAKKISFANRLPKVFSFGKLGYGKPGLNMLSNEFDSYYIVGIGLQWNIWDWKKNKRDKEKLQFNQKIIEYSEESYNQKTKIEMDRFQSNITNLEQKVAKDEEIFHLHKKLEFSAESKFKNGVMQTTDYLKYNNDLIRAQLAMEVHKIQLYREKVNYKILKGEL